MRNLVICCDGTWNTPTQSSNGVPTPTNAVRLYNAVAEKDEQGRDQLAYYHPGVGTRGGWLRRKFEGMLGKGLGRSVQGAYKWLAVNYRPGDRIYLFGFSRGAFTVRSLAGMIAECGLLDLSRELDENSIWRRVDTAYRQGYRKKRGSERWAGDWPFHPAEEPGGLKIHFLGVWDTIGALGVPDQLGPLNLVRWFDNPQDYAFHDTRLGKDVLHARHAIALDETRGSYMPTLWCEVDKQRDVKQLWFPGVHSDIGGNYLERGLADITLKWMADEAGSRELSFKPDLLRQLKPDPQGVLHDSLRGLFRALYSQPRSIPPIVKGEKRLHPSVLKRQAQPPIGQAPYRPTHRMQVGDRKEFEVFAGEHWNASGLYLDQGEYRFEASGQWLDSRIKCGPSGCEEAPLRFNRESFDRSLQKLGTLLGKGEKVYRKWTANPEADFFGTRRHEECPWFALVGAVANGGNPERDGTPDRPETFLVGEGIQCRVDEPGYFYAFANDAWHFYGNNRGSVMLTVERLS